jgi:hypothetical protein
MTAAISLTEAIKSLREVKTVDQWNNTRDAIKASVNDQVKWRKEYVPTIDASGLIVEVLGKDQPKIRQYRTNFSSN